MNKNTFFKFIVIVFVGIVITTKFYPYYPTIKEYINYRKEKIEREKEYEQQKKIHKVDYYPDGTLKSESFEGVTKYYRENGVLSYVIGNDVKEDYDNIGTLIKKDDEKNSEDKKIENEKKEGNYKGYSPEGKLILDYNYKNGKLHGIQKVYFNNSDKLYSEKEYKEGKPTGIHKVYYADGTKHYIIDYSFDKNKILSLEYYYPNELLKTKEIFLCPDENQRILESSEEYNSDGNLISKVTEKGKLKEEERRYYYDNKNLKSISFYRNGKKLENGKEYYENGNMKINQYYDEKSGNLVAEQYYKEGKPLSKTIYMGKSMYGEIKYYIENRSDNSKYYELKREGNKEIERFFDRSGNVVYENIKEVAE